jgi:hypothetical protein
MRDVKSNFFDIYSKNENVSLIILYSDETKKSISARALLWELSLPNGRMFMDRVYTNNYSDEQVFIDFAKLNGWLYKSQQSMGCEISIIDSINNVQKNMQLIVELNNIHDHKKYPYLDTMVYYNPHTGIITNKETKKTNPKYLLTCTDGDYTSLISYVEEPVMIYSNYQGKEIDKNHSVYCVIGDSWVEEDKAVRVWN